MHLCEVRVFAAPGGVERGNVLVPVLQIPAIGVEAVAAQARSAHADLIPQRVDEDTVPTRHARLLDDLVHMCLKRGLVMPAGRLHDALVIQLRFDVGGVRNPGDIVGGDIGLRGTAPQLHGHAVSCQTLFGDGCQVPAGRVPHDEIEASLPPLDHMGELPGGGEFPRVVQERGADLEQHWEPGLDLKTERCLIAIGLDDLASDFAIPTVEEMNHQLLPCARLAGECDPPAQALADFGPVLLECHSVDLALIDDGERDASKIDNAFAVTGNDIEDVFSGANERDSQSHGSAGFAESFFADGYHGSILAAQDDVGLHVPVRVLPFERHSVRRQRLPRQFRGIDRQRQRLLRLLASRPQNGFAESHVPLVVGHLPPWAIGDCWSLGQAHSTPLSDREGFRAIHVGEEGRRLRELVLLLEHTSVVGAEQNQPRAFGDRLDQRVLQFHRHLLRRHLEKHEGVPLLLKQPCHAVDAALVSVPVILACVDDASPEHHVRLEIEPLRKLDDFAGVGAASVDKEQHAGRARHVGFCPGRVRCDKIRVDIVVHLKLGHVQGNAAGNDQQGQARQ